ncbi:MAG: carboxypeptidase regulatory-like domain-containing protein [Beijerinckiaceae bacterium]|jgi:hypothetical protein
MMRFALAALAAMSLSACQSTRGPIPAQATFDAREAAFIHKRGEGQIEGQAFIVLPNGQTRLAAGEAVRLVPSTAYSRARIAHLYGDRKFVRARDIPETPAHPDYVAHTRSTVSTSSGRFRFEGVAPGDYFVVTQKIYRQEGGLLPEGGAMYETVRVSGRETARVVVVGR